MWRWPKVQQWQLAESGTGAVCVAWANARVQDWSNVMTTKDPREKYGALWTRQELILAFDLYCRIPFRKTKANNRDVIELAKLLGRSPASVARKLGNFGSFHAYS